MHQSAFETYPRWESKPLERLVALKEEVEGKRRGSSTFLRWERLAKSMKEVLPPNAQVLDVGAGTGHFVHYLRKNCGFSAIGCEPEGKARELAAELFDSPDWIYEGSVYDLARATTRYDGMVMIEVLEHLQWPEKALMLVGSRTDHLWLTTPSAPEREVLGAKNGMKLHCGFHLREWSPKCLQEFVEGITPFRKQWQYLVDGHIEAYYAK